MLKFLTSVITHAKLFVCTNYHICSILLMKRFDYPNFQHLYSLDLYAWAYLMNFTLWIQVKLCKTWLLPVKWYVPSRVLREFLSYRIKQIIEDDAAIRRDGMDILSDICIRQVGQSLKGNHL